MVEMVVVGTILAAVAALTYDHSARYTAYIGALAVLLTFGHVQIADRLAEAEQTRNDLEREVRALSQRFEHAAEAPPLQEVEQAEQRLVNHVECYRWLRRYLVAKELCWLSYFVMLSAWSALVGVGVFLLYPAWRHYYRKRRPCAGSEQVRST